MEKVTMTKELNDKCFAVIYDNCAKQVNFSKMLTRTKISERLFDGTEVSKQDAYSLTYNMLNNLVAAEFVREYVEPTSNTKFYGVTSKGRKTWEAYLLKQKSQYQFGE